ncbi:MAG: pilus assembly protein PilM [Desulfuromonadales bacterium]|nr:pilus assembly protein PilM [Desulfuromonadales bacterium]
MRLTGNLFRRKSIGVEISPQGVAFALMGGTAASPRLERVAARPFAPGVVQASLRELNILDTQAFGERLAEAHALLLHKGTRLSVSLPDVVGRVLLMDVEGRFKNRNEALDIIRWKLKKSMPFDVSDTHLDYQQLMVRENNDMALLVTLVSRTVIGQYEDLMVAAGFSPARIDLNSFNFYRSFEKRLALLENYALVSFYNGSLSIMVVSEGLPEFIRIKCLPGTLADDNRVFREISNSLLAYRERFPERALHKVACIAAPDVARDFCEMVAEASANETMLLEVKSAVKPSEYAPADQETLFPFTVAIGAALRYL